MRKQPFSRSVKDELARVPLPDSSAQREAELTAFLYTVGSVHIRSGKRHLHLISTHPPTARRLFALCGETTAIRPTVVVTQSSVLNGRVVYRVRVPLDDARPALEEMDCWSEGTLKLGKAAALARTEPDVRKAYLRATFLGGGSVADPSTSYHLEIHCSNAENAEFVCDLLHRLQIRAQLIAGDDGFLLYVKNSESISDFLKAVGARQSLFSFEDVRAMKELRNQINRLVNSETANMTKSIRASLDQLQSIERLTVEMKARLTSRTRELMEARIQNPQASLRELGEMLDPPVSKSTVEYHFRKIRQLAGEA